MTDGHEKGSGTTSEKKSDAETRTPTERPEGSATGRLGGVADLEFAKDRLPAGAVARIGGVKFRSPDAIRKVSGPHNGIVLTCGNDYVRVWEASSGAMLWQVRAERGDARCALSPDGRLVAVSTGAIGESMLDVYDWRGGAKSPRTSFQRVVAVEFVDDKRVLVVSNRVAVLDAMTATTNADVRATAIRAAVKADGSILTIGGTSLGAWAPGESEVKPLATLPGRVRDASFDGTRALVAWTTGSEVGVTDVATGTSSKVPNDAGTKVDTVALSPDGTLLAVGFGGGLAVWSVKDPRKLWEVTPQRKTPVAPALTFSPDGASVLFANTLTVVVAKATTGAAEPAGPRPAFVGWSKEHDAVLRQGDRTWSVAPPTGAEVALAADFGKAPKDVPQDVDDFWVLGDQVVANATDGGCSPLRVWTRGKWTDVPAPRQCDPDVGTPTWMVDQAIAVGSNSAAPPVVDLATGKAIGTLKPEGRPVVAFAVARDRKTFLVAFGSGAPQGAPLDDPRAQALRGTTLELWPVANGEPRKLELAKEGLTVVALSADGRRAYLGWRDGEIEAVGTADFVKPSRLGEQTSGIRSMQLAPDGTLLAATDEDGTTTIWTAR